jgi:hypothetical protein
MTNGWEYIGEYRDGKRNGQGTVTWSDGVKYVGEFKDGKLNGQGTLTWANGTKYVGQFRDGKMGGTGKLIHPDGKVENDGEWKDDNFVRASATEPTP